MVIWSKLIRLIHWCIAVALILNLYFLEEGDPPHEYVGYAATVFVLIRLIYGFTSQDAASFRNFPVSWTSIKEFIKSKLKSEKKDYRGHNPLASVVYILLWACVIGLGITGWMMGLDRFFGDEWLEEIHEYISILTQVLIALHFIGMALDSYIFKRKSWMAMLTGKKT